MARRPLLGRSVSVVSAAPQQDVFALLELSADERKEFANTLGDCTTLERTLGHLNDSAAMRQESTQSQSITDAMNIGAMWRLVDKHSGDWSVRIAPDGGPYTLSLDQLYEITLTQRVFDALPAEKKALASSTGNGGGRIQQRELVVWDETPEGEVVRPVEERTGRLEFRFLRQPQRAMLVSYSVPYLAVCSRIFDAKPASNVAASVKWVEDHIKSGDLTGRPRKAEGVEYVADCLRIHNAFTRQIAANKSTGEAMEAAQKAIAPRGGAPRQTGVTAAEMATRRLQGLAIHALVALAKLGGDNPFNRLFPNIGAVLQYAAHEGYRDYEQAAWDEFATIGDSVPLASLTLPAAAKLYAAPWPQTANIEPAVNGMDDRQIRNAVAMRVAENAVNAFFGGKIAGIVYYRTAEAARQAGQRLVDQGRLDEGFTVQQDTYASGNQFYLDPQPRPRQTPPRKKAAAKKAAPRKGGRKKAAAAE